ncbi:MAG TPA: efflux RND transporter periplasmic adaptor subunit [Gemmataceae bacterium]|nr:efflux RND transporter periplasmic adaptor subunit [Gemmataceae bacterium]
MHSLPHRVQRWALLAGACLGLVGCAPAAPPAPPPPAVSVSVPLVQEVADYNTFTGRTAAVDSVQVRSHVWGYLDKVKFTEGAEVHKGDVLFKIDSRPYDHALAQAEAALKQAEARRDNLADSLARDRASPGATPLAVMIQDQGAFKEAEAAVSSARAARDSAQLNVTYTDVIAPVSGRVGRAMVTEGNLVQSGDQAGGTLLTTVVSVDPMWVYFDVDDLTYLRVNQLLREGKYHPGAGPPKVELGLANEDGFPRVGVIDFVDNQVDPATGTIRMRGVFPNKDGAMTAGLFGRVRVPSNGKHKAVLVTERAVDTDQGEKVVYVVGLDNVAEKRSVRLGGSHEGLREIESGVQPGERVVVDGIQWVQAAKPVAPTLVDMPSPQREGEKGR